MIFKILTALKLGIDRHSKDYSKDYVEGYNSALIDFRDRFEKDIDSYFFKEDE